MLVLILIITTFGSTYADQKKVAFNLFPKTDNQGLQARLEAALSNDSEFQLIDVETRARTLDERNFEGGAPVGTNMQQSALPAGADFYLDIQLIGKGKDQFTKLRITDTSTAIAKSAIIEYVDWTEDPKSWVQTIMVQCREMTHADPAPASDAYTPLPVPENLKRPSVSVVIPEAAILRDQPQPPDPAGETELQKVFLELNFPVLDYHSHLDSKEPGIRDYLSAATNAGADYLIYGEAFSETSGQVGEFDASRARLEIKVIDTATRKIVYSDSAYGGSGDTAEMIAGKQAIQIAARAIGKDLPLKLAKIFNQ